jgi:hypothetical protein
VIAARPAFGTWAAAAWDQAEDQLVVAGFRSQTAPNGDLFSLALGHTTGTGTVTLDQEPCLQGEKDDCPIGVLGFNMQPGQGEFDPSVAQLYIVTSGTVNITTYTSDRVAGTFAGTAVHSEAFTGVPDPRTITIANGSFDVPLLRE